MRPWAASASSADRREGFVGRRRACLALSSCWALIGAIFGLWVFRAWVHPVPAFNPNDGPIGTDANLSFWMGAPLMAVPLASFSAALAATGLEYLRSVRTTWRIRVAWASAVTAGVVVDVVFIGTFMSPGSVLGMGLGRVNWGLLALSASFAAVGGAMVTIITAAANT
jgi:hypothetical protein